MHTCIPSHGLQRHSWHSCPSRLISGDPPPPPPQQKKKQQQQNKKPKTNKQTNNNTHKTPHNKQTNKNKTTTTTTKTNSIKQIKTKRNKKPTKNKNKNKAKQNKQTTTTKTHIYPVCTIHEDGMWLPQWLDWKTITYTEISPQNSEPQRYSWGAQKRKRPRSSSSSAFPSYIYGVHHFWVKFLRMWPFFNPTIKVVTFRLRGWCVLGVFLLPAFTRLGHERQDLLSPCDEMHVMHRLDLGLYSHPKEFLGNGVWTHVNSKGKIPSKGKISPGEDRTRDAVDSEPKHYQRAIPAPRRGHGLSRSLSPQWPCS